MLVARGCENDLPYPRLGLAVGRPVGSAVVRNRWKRLIREAFRLTRSQLPTGVDLVISPRKGAAPSLDGIRSSILRLAKRLSRKLRKPAS
jgi:ribonuclease P protein component